MTTGNGIALFSISVIAVAVTAYTPFHSRAAMFTMSFISMLVGVGVILNTWFYTTCLGGTPVHPILINDDCFRWWNDALYHIKGTGLKAAASYGFYGYVLSGVLYIFEPTVGAALLWSMSLILTALFLTGLLTYRLCGNRQTALIAIVSTAAVCYWLAMGTLILKDSFVIVAMLVGALGLTTNQKQKFLSLTALSALMLSVSRPSFIWLLIVGVLLLHLRRKNRLSVILSIGIAVILWYIPICYGQLGNVSEMVNSPETGGFSFTAPNQMALYNLIGNYAELPLYKKILFLPLTAAVQFFIPFFWTMARDIPFGLTETWAHIGIPWYFFGFYALYSLVVNYKKFRTQIYRLTVWAALCWLVPCFLFGGTVSRYGLPFVALFAPAVAILLHRNYKKRKFYVVTSVYAIIVTFVLIVAYHLQSSAMQ